MYKLNYWLLAAVGITAFLLSIIWYSPLLWGSIWQHYRSTPNPNIPQWTLLFAPLRETIVSGIIAMLLIKLHINTYKQAVLLMFVLWFGFHAVEMAGAVLWDNMNWKLGLVHGGDWLMKLSYIGCIQILLLKKGYLRQDKK